jgi:hypothetical protein
MSALTVPYLTAAVLLVVAGWSKAVSPQSTVTAARGAGLPASASLVRLLAGAEVVIGVAGLGMDGAAPAALVAASYLGFALFLTRGLLRGDLDSCGCFAGEEARPTWLHVALDALLALTAVTVAVADRPTSLWHVVAGRGGWPVALLVAATALLTYTILSGLPAPGEVPERLRSHDPEPAG